MGDLRQAFLASETLAERIRGFRRERLSQIAVGETPLLLPPGAKLVLHLLPASSFELGSRFRLSDDLQGKLRPIVQPVDCIGWSHGFNFDGLAGYCSSGRESPADAYTQVFHNGVVEAVSTTLLDIRVDKKVILSEDFDTNLVNGANRYLALQLDLGVGLPVWVCLSLLGWG